MASTDPTFADLPRCPSCENPMLASPENKCPLCGFVLNQGDEVAEDATPYADASQHGYWKMVRWVLTAGTQRLSFLSRMRRSRESAQFAAINLLLIALACVLIAVPHAGWRRINMQDATWRTGFPEPQNPGWILVADQKRNGTNLSENGLAQLWFSPPIAIITATVNGVMGLLLGMFTLFWTRAGSNLALKKEYRWKDRFGAAVHYGTAHATILLLAALLYGSSVLNELARAGQWSVQWPRSVHIVPAFLIGGLGLFLMWFWYLRLAHTSPASTLARVSRYFILWAPTKAILIMGGWLTLQQYGLPRMFKWLDMSF